MRSSTMKAAPVGVAAMEAATASPIETDALGPRQVCTDCSEGEQDE